MSERPDRTEADALRALEERLARATAAAERLLAEADVAAGEERVPASGPAGEDGVPAGGWQRREDGSGSGGAARPWPGWIEAADAELLLGLLTAVRELVPAELQQRLAAALREVLLALRALVDWCLQRAERRRAAPAEVQDIPIL